MTNNRLLRFIFYSATFLIVVVSFFVVVLRLNYSGGGQFPDRTAEPVLDPTALEVVAELSSPPANIAVADNGRIFFTYHGKSREGVNLAELVEGRPYAYPSMAWQPGGEHPEALTDSLGIRIDQQQRLWVLDNGAKGMLPARLLAFSLTDNQLVHSVIFNRAIFPFASHANDLQITADGRYVIIADASLLRQQPAIIVYDTQTGQSRRLLDEHESVEPDFFMPSAEGKPLYIAGFIVPRVGVDSIAIDHSGTWLYYAAVTAEHMYRVKLSVLLDSELPSGMLEKSVEIFALKTMSDGISMDNASNIYLTDPQHNAVHILNAEGKIITLFKNHPLLRWPDGTSFGPDGWLYITPAAIHQVLGKSAEEIKVYAPFHILRFQTGKTAVSGH